VVMAPSTGMTRIYRREHVVEEAGLPLEVGLRRKMYLPEGKTRPARDRKVL
jgi:hypothetical protein